MPIGRQTNYQDPLTIVEGSVSYDEPVERAAIVAHRLTFETAAEVASSLGSPTGRQALAKTWLQLKPHERQRWRRHADETVQAYLTPLEFLAAPSVDDDLEEVEIHDVAA